MNNLRADLNFPGVCDMAHGHALPRPFRAMPYAIDDQALALKTRLVGQ
jgi:hypothetical protein